MSDERKGGRERAPAVGRRAPSIDEPSKFVPIANSEKSEAFQDLETPRPAAPLDAPDALRRSARAFAAHSADCAVLLAWAHLRPGVSSSDLTQHLIGIGVETARLAQTKVPAIERKAIVEIEMSCLQAQTEIAVAGLTSEAARGFVDRLPRIETLMPRLSFAEVAGEADPPIAEQLVSPNALRQRRFRERQAALSDAGPALHNGQALQPPPPAADPPKGNGGGEP
jgi:hypothetical protein